MKCLNCGEEIKQTPKKKEKIFCNSTCRSNYWQKSDRLEKQGLGIEEIVKKISEGWKPKKPIVESDKKETKANNKVESNISAFWKKRMADKLGIK